MSVSLRNATRGDKRGAFHLISKYYKDTSTLNHSALRLEFEINLVLESGDS